MRHIDQRTVGGLRFSSSTRLSTVLVDWWASRGVTSCDVIPHLIFRAQQQPHRNQRQWSFEPQLERGVQSSKFSFYFLLFCLQVRFYGDIDRRFELFSYS